MHSVLTLGDGDPDQAVHACPALYSILGSRFPVISGHENGRATWLFQRSMTRICRSWTVDKWQL